MAVPRKFFIAPNSATRDLWRVAESGDVDELEELLPHADLNARNEHGMTALMRAAYHGRTQMVRALLEHGADPNVARNDNFTALSLAAFFGHSEIVELLVNCGARTDVATRYGTSPHMWAKARSFGDVAQSLQKPVPPPRVAPEITRAEPVAPIPEREPVAPIIEREIATPPEYDSPSLEVRTLSDPPEIWDLVHEAPRNFSRGSAFVARVGSITAGIAVCVAVLVIVTAGMAGVWYWKDAPPAPRVATAPVTPTTISTSPVTTTTNTAAADVPPLSLPEPANNDPQPTITVPQTVARTNTLHRSFTKRRPPQTETTAANVETVAPPAPVPVAPKADATTHPVTTKTTAPLSPQLIAPPKTQPPKGKVIQWP